MTSVLSEKDGGLAILTLNRPHRLNAMTEELVETFARALEAAMADPGIRVILMRGAGRAFCAGDDLKEFSSQSRDQEAARRYLDRIQDTARLILEGDKVVIAAAHGWAAGGGLEWLINADLVIMGEGTRCFFPEVSLGFMVTGAASALLPRMIGLSRARALMLLGETFDASEAHQMGLVYRVVADDAVEAQALALARRVMALPARAVRDMKRAINRGMGLDLEPVLALERDAVLAGFLDPETAERVVRLTPGRK
jgi:enoyl-CoA hydratase/carnithine racemase